MTKSEIADAEGISAGYVQQLMMALRLADIVDSHRGREGGFSLSRPAEEITVADVLSAVEGEVMPAPCQGRRTLRPGRGLPHPPRLGRGRGVAERPFRQDHHRLAGGAARGGLLYRLGKGSLPAARASPTSPNSRGRL